jgi:ABC-type transport system substrate-binding protein
VLQIAGTTDEAIDDVSRGRADVLLLSEPFSQSQRAKLETQYASHLHTNPGTTTVGLFLNTRVAPFDRLDVRRALNYAADRAAALRAAGLPNTDQPTCQILPPNFPGYRPYCPYTARPTARGRWAGPNLTRARALVARSGTRGMRVTVWSATNARGYNTFAVKLLRSLGYRASMKVVGDNYVGGVSDSRNKAQIGFTGWQADYPAASNFFGPNFSCASFTPGNPLNTNMAEFCDPRIDREIDAALTEQATDPAAARRLWQRVEREIVDQAPWVPLHNFWHVDVLSKRVGNYQYSPAAFGALIDQLWVR